MEAHLKRQKDLTPEVDKVLFGSKVNVKMLSRLVDPNDMMQAFEKSVELSFQDIIVAMGACFRIDVKNKNFEETPKRIARAYAEILGGLVYPELRIEEILSKTFPGKSDEMVVVGPVHVWSMCPHHFLPVEMNVWVSYIPYGKILGISKLARLAELIAKKPALQETTTVEIAETLQKYLEPKGSACIIRGRHLCMEMRGAKQASVTTTTSLFGAFRRQATREEFLSAVNARR